MKTFKFLFLGLMTLSIVLVGCGKDDPPKPVSYVEDGFYVVGAATAVADLFADDAELALMAAGINEVGQAGRQGMYEKYVALEGGKNFQLMLKAGVNETPYGAALSSVNLEGANEQPDISVLKGTLTENGAAMQVTTSGLYHIVVDVPLNTVVIAPVDWGLKGAAGDHTFPKPTFNKTSMTYKLTNVTFGMSGWMKFAYGGGWKLELNSEIKANTNLGNDGSEGPITAKLAPGGPNIIVEKGVWEIELTWTLAKGAIKESYTANLKKTGEVETPDNLYMIGAEFGDWDWNSDGIVDMIPVNGVAGAFWCINYFTAGEGFKWSTEKDWGKDFAGLDENSGYDFDGGNAVVAEDGLYSVYINVVDNKIVIEPAKVYGIGDCFGSWETEDHPFEVDADGTTMSITTSAKNNLRMYAYISTVAELDLEWGYWWRLEFNIFDGKIVYRGNGGDQDNVEVDAGKTVTLDFKAGTGTIE